jgi:hypothetical protein
MLAVVPAALLSLSAAAQVEPPSGSVPADRVEPTYKWEVFAGPSYTSLNQVNQSRYGLIGGMASVNRNWGKYFAVTADGAYYVHPVGSGDPGNPKVEMVLAGPVIHAELYGPISGFVHALLGGVHTAGESETPNISFAGGFGGGAEYRLSPRLAIRASGEDVFSSFVQDPGHLGYSPHLRGNARASVGVVYRF